MNPNVTFFYNESESGGAAWRTTVRTRGADSSCRSLTLYAYATSRREAAALRGLDSDGVLDEGDYHRLLSEVQSAVGSGLLLEEEAGPSGSELRCRTAKPNVAWPEEVLLLRPGYPVAFVPLERKIRLPPGGHLILPVDTEAEEKLRNFLAQLRWFSPDVESLVLNTIWRPGLERRIEGIEKRLGIPKDPAHAEPSSIWQKWWSRGLRRGQEALDAALRYSPVFATLLLLVLLAGNTQIFWSVGGEEGPSPRRPARATQGAGDGDDVPETAADEDAEEKQLSTDVGAEAEITAQLRQLHETLAALPAKRPERVLYGSHFTDSPVRSFEDLSGRENFAWGFVKLIYLRKKGFVNVPGEGEGGKIDEIVLYPKSRSWTRVALEQMMPTFSDKEKLALALVTCKAFGRSHGGLPGTRGDWKFESIDMEQDCEFDDVELRLASDSLRSLNDHLRMLQTEGNT